MKNPVPFMWVSTVFRLVYQAKHFQSHSDLMLRYLFWDSLFCCHLFEEARNRKQAGEVK